MWLLNNTTLKLELYVEERSRPYYVILSHTWGDGEVSFQEIQRLTDDIRARKGFKKIVQFCEQAKYDGFEYVWIDTCCIDKTNSVDLSEAINSMYRWYRNAVECFVHLADVNTSTNGLEFEARRWFTRGWKLQELIAPPSIVFYDSQWIEIGTKQSLCKSISKITSIPVRVLLDQSFKDCSIAQKMCWASRRETTRLEDFAYCLLGIFGISMPLIYGENEKAFERLQLEIIKTSNDQSLFAWKGVGDDGNRRGAFAKSPKEFASCGDIWRIHDIWPIDNQLSPPYSMTNLGLEISLPMEERLGDHYHPGIKVGFLNCVRLKDDTCITIGIILEREYRSKLWNRCYPKELYENGFPARLLNQANRRLLFGRGFPTEITKLLGQAAVKLLICSPQLKLSSWSNYVMFSRHNSTNEIIIRTSGLNLLSEQFQHVRFYQSLYARVMLFQIPRNEERFLVMLGLQEQDRKP